MRDSDVVVRVLGPVGVDGSERELSPSLRRLLAILVARGGQTVSVDALIEALWPEGAPGADGTRALRTAVSRLRQVLGAAIVTQAPGYRLALTEVSLDADEFEAALRRLAGEPAVELSEIDAALALWRGPAFQEFAHEPWANSEAVRLEELRAAAQERRLELLGALGRHAEAVAEAERFIAEHPYRDGARQLLMTSLARSGRQADALRAYQDFREVMAEAGLEPSAVTRALEADIASDSLPTLAGPEPNPGLLPNPVDFGDRRTLSHVALDPGRVPFVGRATERAALDAAIERCAAVVVVCGEAGVGKTRLVHEVAEGRVGRGELVLTGSCSEDLATPYGPLLLAGTALLERAGDDLLVALGSRGRDLIDLLGGVAARPEADAESDRFRVVEALRALLKLLVRDGRVILVLDDLQWADSSTAAVLRDLVLRRPIDGVVVVATQRDTELAPHAPAAALLADLHRHHHNHEMHLSGLSASALVELTADAGVDVGRQEAVARSVHERTNGNALFAVQLLRFLVDRDADGVGSEDSGPPSGPTGAVPTEVGDLVARRVERLGPGVAGLLDAAAVVGTAFDLAIVADLTGRPLDTAIDQADAAVTAGLLIEDTGRFGRYAFVHAVVRDALLARQSASRRTVTSWRAGEAIEAAAGEQADRRAAELAHLYSAGVAAGDPLRATRWLLVAGTQAYEAASFLEATTFAGRALTILDGEPHDDPLLRVRALALQVQALRRHGDPADVDDLAASALDAAIDLGEPDLIADIAAGGVGPLVNYSPARNNAPVALTARALVALPADAAATRTRVAAAHAFWVQRNNAPDAPALADAAIASARELGDDAVLADTIATVLHTYMGADLAGELEARTAELEDLIERTGRRDLLGPLLWGTTFRVVRAGQMDAWGELIDRWAAEARRVGWISGIWIAELHRTSRECAVGRPRQVLAALQDLIRLGQDLGVPLAFCNLYLGGVGGNAMYVLGDFEGVLALTELGIATPPDLVPLYSAAQAVGLAHVGRLGESRILVDGLARDDFASLRYMAMRECSLGWMAEAVRLLGDDQLAAALHGQLTPMAGRIIWTTNAQWGPVDLWTAIASIGAGELDRADAELSQAEELCRGAGLRTWLAHVEVEQANLALLQGDPALAKAKAAAAVEVADELGLAGVASTARDVLERA